MMVRAAAEKQPRVLTQEMNRDQDIVPPGWAAGVSRADGRLNYPLRQGGNRAGLRRTRVSWTGSSSLEFQLGFAI